MYRFIIPLKALSWNSAYRMSQKKMFLSRKGKKFKEDCQEFLKEQFTEEQPLKNNLKVKILFHELSIPFINLKFVFNCFFVKKSIFHQKNSQKF